MTTTNTGAVHTAPLDHGDYVQVTRGTHRGQKGVISQVGVNALDSQVRVDLESGKRLWFPYTWIRRAARDYSGLPETSPAILRALIHPRHHERLGIAETDGAK